MREIKFRGWDEQNKVMHNEVEFIRSGTDGNDWILFKSDKQKLKDGNVLNNPYFQQQIKLMQYTGLKDKNGVEIYEGDIISTPYFGNLQVKYSLHSGGFIYYPIDRNAMCSPSEKVINDLFHLNYSKDVEEIVNYFNKDNNGNYLVIGNIYENKELLK